VGAWITGAANLADTSGYTPAGTHDGYGVTGVGVPSSAYGFTNDVPLQTSGQSLALQGTAAIAITNSSNLDGAYLNTFDDTITNMTVLLWAKGWPGAWNPFISKYGEGGVGWQLRRNAGGNNPVWTVRGTGTTEDMAGNIVMGADGNWHLYAGTYTFDGVTGTRNLYVDGVLRASQAEIQPYALTIASHLTIGGRDNNGNNFGQYFNGQIYGARIYNTALSQAQVNSFMPTNAFAVPPPPINFVRNGNNVVLNWSYGTLQTATNLPGPWTSSAATSPYTNNVTTASRMFFRLVYP
jgi:hypothetical protein